MKLILRSDDKGFMYVDFGTKTLEDSLRVYLEAYYRGLLQDLAVRLNKPVQAYYIARYPDVAKKLGLL